MEDPTPVAPLPQKRPHTDDDDDVAPAISTPSKQIRSEASTPLSVLSVQTPSPLKSSAPSSTGPNSSNVSVPTTSQPAKRRKVTSQEKETQRLEKEAKAKAREEKKAQKEAEEKVKAEQKAQREEEKRKKNEERDEKKRLKEEEQQRIEDEKAKKARVSRPPSLQCDLNSANR
jgi:chromatin assembly factor 1 subunit A